MSSIKDGWQLIKYSTSIFLRYPVMVMPLLFTWLLYAPTILYFKYSFNSLLKKPSFSRFSA